MITPNNVRKAALKTEAENHRFRKFLKAHADEKKLDQQFLGLHKELFASYDCSKCRNCCRAYDVLLENEEVSTIAAAKGLTHDTFCKQFLSDGLLGYEIKSHARFCAKMDSVKLNSASHLSAPVIPILIGRTEWEACSTSLLLPKFALLFMKCWND